MKRDRKIRQIEIGRFRQKQIEKYKEKDRQKYIYKQKIVIKMQIEKNVLKADCADL